MARKYSELRDRMSPQSQIKSERLYEQAVEHMALDELRKAQGLTQEQLAATLDVKQASVSKIESQTDMYVSTLRRFVEACGGTLRITAIFPSGSVEVERFGTEAPAEAQSS